MFELGSSLRDARARKRLSFADLEQATKVRAKYLRALEEDDFATLPGPTYVKGFLRVYAEALGLDGQLYVDEYASRFHGGDEEVLIRPRRMQPPRRVGWVERNAVVLALVGIAVVTGIVIGAWRFVPHRSGTPSVQPATSQGTGAGAGKATRAATAPAAGRRASGAAGARRPVVGTVSPVKLVLRAKANTWVEVHDTSAAGRLIFQGTIERGESQRFTAKRLWLNVGSPVKLSATVNGHAVTLPGGAQPKVLVATANGVAPLVGG